MSHHTFMSNAGRYTPSFGSNPFAYKRASVSEDLSFID
jgi:hypothetical protein